MLPCAIIAGGGDLGGVHAAAFTHARETLPIVRLLQIVYYVSLMLLVIIVIPTFMVALFGFTPQHFIQVGATPACASRASWCVAPLLAGTLTFTL